MTRSFLDTNVLIYYFDRGEPAKRSVARELVDDEMLSGRAVVSTQVLQEFFVNVVKLNKPMSLDDAEAAVRAYATTTVVQLDTDLVLAAIQRHRSDMISLWDALIVEAALVGGASRLYSEDLRHGREIGGMRIENPFASTGS